jgi:hypothetical protein
MEQVVVAARTVDAPMSRAAPMKRVFEVIMFEMWWFDIRAERV